jgi:hypothetical protein
MQRLSLLIRVQDVTQVEPVANMLRFRTDQFALYAFVGNGRKAPDTDRVSSPVRVDPMYEVGVSDKRHKWPLSPARSWVDFYILHFAAGQD